MPIIAQAPSDSRLNPAILGPAHRAEVSMAVLHLLPDWEVELIDDTTIMVSPLDGEDVSGPTIMVYAVGDRFRIDSFRWDTFSNIADSVAWAEVPREVLIAAMWETVVSHAVH